MIILSCGSEVKMIGPSWSLQVASIYIVYKINGNKLTIKTFYKILQCFVTSLWNLYQWVIRFTTFKSSVGKTYISTGLSHTPLLLKCVQYVYIIYILYFIIKIFLEIHEREKNIPLNISYEWILFFFHLNLLLIFNLHFLWYLLLLLIFLCISLLLYSVAFLQ